MLGRTFKAWPYGAGFRCATGRLTMHFMDQDVDGKRCSSPAGWLEAVERGEAEIAAGRTVSAEDVLRRMQESVARLETMAPASRED